MPRLRPQKISGLVVIPTVDPGGGIWRVSIAINVGSSRSGSPPPEIVTREDLIVELFGPGGSFEAILSPDPGPLPVRVLRVAQARGEYSFASGTGPPTEVRVRLSGGTATFPMTDTFPAAQGFTDVPQVGDGFPIPPGTSSVVTLINRGVLSIPRRVVQLIRPPRKKLRCRVQRFDAPLNRNKNATARSELFEIEADFSATPRPYRCRCCEYRQFVRGEFSDAAGDPVRFDLPAGPLATGEYREDGNIDELGPGMHGYYGHRGTSSPGDTYNGAGTADGCHYRADETPRCPPSETVHAEFLGLVVDVCRGTVVAVRTWAVDL